MVTACVVSFQKFVVDVVRGTPVSFMRTLFTFLSFKVVFDISSLFTFKVFDFCKYVVDFIYWSS